ncbi:rhodanese-like domain-containing protein [Rhodoferax sp.]|uniref:rhodanese-like domain-containing protein n=1 Tax=Rhodoferax sp. TaxID=50421 RepID=UPI002719A731|nr:rhodanese-like domain-containing protein [Rhodoferax sp.]MDO8320544.1 rhodanese-like domain-containing protein [Rhodoferax sp.]
MTPQNTTPTPFPLQNFQSVRQALLNQHEIALLDVREEDTFAQAHPLFAANLPLARIALDARHRIPRLDTLTVVYDAGEGLAQVAAQTLQQLGYSQVHLLDGGLQGWQQAGGEVFKDVNVPSKAFGELVDAQRHTPMLSAQEVKALLDAQTNVVVLDARRFDEYQTMNIPTSISVPGAELVLRVGALAPDPRTRIIVNCAGRTRSIIGTQSLVNAGIPNPVAALRNGTIGWTLAGQTLEHSAARRATPVPEVQRLAAAQQARAVADRAGVKRAQLADVLRFRSETARTSYCLDVRTPEEYAAGHLSGFASAPGGQLVQETDVTLPVRGARAVLADLDGVRANMTASWLAQMGWEVWVLDGLQATDFSETGQLPPPVPPSPHRYRRPYEGTDNPHEAMQGYLDWEYGLVAQLARDGTHGFHVI